MLKIIVTVKPVPDTTAPKNLDRQSFKLVRTATTVLNPFDEFAIEAALRLREEHEGTTVTIVAMAPPSAREALRKALGMGADAAVLVSDERLAGADARATSIVLAAAVGQLLPDLVLTGIRSSDAGGGYLSRMLAQRLDLPAMLGLRSLAVIDGHLRGERLHAGRLKQLDTSLPALASLTKEIGAVRYPSLKGIMAAKNKPLTVLTLEDLHINAQQIRSVFEVIAITPRPPRAAAKVLHPSSAEEAARAILDFLIERKALS